MHDATQEACVALLITLNRRLATAAAAMVQRMINRRRPRVFRLVSPFKKGSISGLAMSKEELGGLCGSDRGCGCGCRCA